MCPEYHDWALVERSNQRGEILLWLSVDHVGAVVVFRTGSEGKDRQDNASIDFLCLHIMSLGDITFSRNLGVLKATTDKYIIELMRYAGKGIKEAINEERYTYLCEDFALKITRV